MKAVILAAGIGSRLRPLTDESPKCLIKVQGKSILQHQVEALEQAGIREIIIVTGYQNRKLRDLPFFKGERAAQIKFLLNEDYLKTNNMYSLSLCSADVRGRDFFWCNADVVYSPEIIKSLVQSTQSCIGVDIGTYDEESMKVTAAADRLTGISKTITAQEALGRSIDAYRLTAKDSETLFGIIEKEYLSAGNLTAWTEVALDHAFRNRTLQIAPMPISKTSHWVEIDNKEDLLRAEATFKSFDPEIASTWVFDLDGTLYLDNKPIDGAIQFIQNLRESGKKVYFVTNNSSKSTDDYLAKLSALGFSCKRAEIILSTHSLAFDLKTANVKRVYSVGTESFDRELSSLGFSVTKENPEAVVVGFDTSLTYEKLAFACKLINQGLPYYASHPDIFCPTADGPMPDAGAMTDLIRSVTGVLPRKISGKPDHSMLKFVIEDSKSAPGNIVVVGDRLSTDGALGLNWGASYICVLTGETTLSMLQQRNTSNWPHLIVSSVADIPLAGRKIPPQ